MSARARLSSRFLTSGGTESAGIGELNHARELPPSLVEVDRLDGHRGSFANSAGGDSSAHNASVIEVLPALKTRPSTSNG
jgi:hypothetical protein